MNIENTVATEVSNLAHKVTETAKAELGKLESELKAVETKLHDALFGSGQTAEAAPAEAPVAVEQATTEQTQPAVTGTVEAKN